MSPDIVGTIAAIVIFASFVLRGETQIRLVNLVGSVLFVWYGYSIGNHLFMFMSVAIILVHCYQIWYRIKESRSAKKIAKAEQRAANAEAKVDEQKIQLQNLMNGQNQPEANQINTNDSKL